MMTSRRAPSELSLAEAVAVLSLATDMGMGLPFEHALRSCLLAVRLGEDCGLNKEELRDVYYVSLLRRIGCTGDSHELAAWFGDDLAAHSRSLQIDFAQPWEVLGDVLLHAGEGRPLFQRLWTLATVLAGSQRELNTLFRTSCEIAARLAERIGFGPTIQTALAQTFERWDGKGRPNGLKRNDLALAARVAQIAEDAEVSARVGGVDAAVAVVRRGAHAAYDPWLAERFCQRAGLLFQDFEAPSMWEAVLAADPGPKRPLTDAELDNVLLAMADFADLKTPFMGDHSRRVAVTAAEAGRAAGLAPDEVIALRRAALVHDLGRVSVPNGIWEKRGPLAESEWERVRLHPYLVERVLARSEALAPLGALASLHHERLDGSGYHRGVPAAFLPVPARILAAADAYQAMTDVRPYRAAHAPESAALVLREEARRGRLDGEAVEAVLTAAGHAARARREWPAGLTAREVEVLRFLAQGLTKRQIAQELVISEHTADHHIRHIYEKTGVTTRAGVALFAMQHGLLGPGVVGK